MTSPPSLLAEKKIELTVDAVQVSCLMAVVGSYKPKDAKGERYHLTPRELTERIRKLWVGWEESDLMPGASPDSL